MRLAVLSVALVMVPLGCVDAGPHPDAPACPIFPADNVWHSDIRDLPVHARSADWIAAMGGPDERLHPDFGPSDTDQPYGIPYEVVEGDHPKLSVAFDYDDESDPGPYPFDADTPIEGGSDRHALMIDRDACILYELFAADHNDGSPTAGSGAVWDLRSNALRPAGWTSADAAGLPIFAGLVRRDEVEAGAIDHAIRVTASRTDRSYLWPARHHAGHANDPALPPMGARFRLKESYDLGGFLQETRVVLRAMQVHGLILADNGSDWFFGGASEVGWSDEVLDELKSVPAGAFEAVDASSLVVDAASGEARQRARTALSSRIRPRSLLLGALSRMRGVLSPATHGAAVHLQRKKRGGWATIRRRVVGADGRYLFRLRAGRTGRFRYRVVHPGGPATMPATSPARTVTVRSA